MTSMFYYTVSTNNATTYTLTLYGGFYAKSGTLIEGLTPAYVKVTMAGTGQTSKTAKTRISNSVSSGDHTLQSSYTWSWSKTHSTQTVTVSSLFQSQKSDTFVEDYGISYPQASKSFSIGAKTSYAVTYNANGGTGAPGNQTKWYGENLTITSSKPTKNGYTFKGWATSTANAAAGTVNYASGSTYSANAGITLYAVWELAYTKPAITNMTVERCTSNGTLDDEGAYAKVSFDWSVFVSENARYYGGDTYPYTSNTVSSCTVEVGSKSATPTLSGTSGSESVVVGDGTFDTDTQYTASVSITDSQQIQSGNTTTVTADLATAVFPMDFNANATAVGFFMPAPENENGAFFKSLDDGYGINDEALMTKATRNKWHVILGESIEP